VRSRNIPYATITLALIITVIQVLRSLGGTHEGFVFANLHHGSWETYYNQPWRMLTSPFIHRNIQHYLGNFLFLLVFGYRIERAYGWKYVLGVFFGALVTGYVVHLTVMHEGIIGISGGVCGLFGFSLIANRRTPWWQTFTKYPLHGIYLAGLIWFVIADYADLLPSTVAHVNHAVGILYGIGFGMAFLLMPRNVRWRWAILVLPILFFASQLYSPWQLEWQLLHSQPVLNSSLADCRTHTIEEKTPAVITFVNSSDKPVVLYLMSFEGRARFQNILQPGESTGYNVSLTHAWCVVELESREAIQLTVVTEPEQTFTIR